MKEIKQTLTKGEALDIADAKLYNADVKGVNYSGEETRTNSKVIKADASKYDERTDLTNSILVNHIRTYKDEDSESLYITTDTFGDSISVNGYVRDADRDESGTFSMYFKSREEVIDFAEKCLDAFAIKEAKVNLKEQYQASDLYSNYIHPDAFNSFPTLEEKLKIESGRYYWDINKLVEITEDTDEEITDSLWHYDVDEDGNFKPDWFNKKAEAKLEGFARGKMIDWSSEDYQGINLSKLATFYVGGYDKGYYHTKVRLESDRRKKKDITVFVFADRTVKELDGIWNITDAGELRKSWS